MSKRPTPEADLALTLMGAFVAEVTEFRSALGEFSASDLRDKLQIHRRCSSRSTPLQRETAAVVLGLLTTRLPRCPDWRELVDEDEHDNVEKLIQEYPEKFAAPAMPLAEVLFPPPALYFDKNSQDLAKMYNCSTETGLTEEQVLMAREHYGLNVLPPAPKESLLKMIFTQFTDFMVVILLVAAIVEYIVGDAA